MDCRMETCYRSAVKQPKTTLLTLTASSATELQYVSGQTVLFPHYLLLRNVSLYEVTVEVFRSQDTVGETWIPL